MFLLKQFMCVQSALGVQARIQSLSAYAVSSCEQKLLACPGKTAPSLDTASPANATASLTALAPVADAIATSANYTAPLSFAFSASTDPGAASSLPYAAIYTFACHLVL